MKEMLVIQRLLERLARNKRDSNQKLMEKLRNQSKRAQSMVQRLIVAMNAKKANALSLLVRNKNERKFMEFKESNNGSFQKMIREAAAKKIRDRC